MVAAEQLLADWMPEACTLRISLPMGVSFNGHAGAIDWIQSRFKKGRPATLYYDEVRTPAYTDCLNRLYERVLASDLCGVYHAGGPLALSLYEIAQIVNRVGGYDPKLLMGCPRIDAGPIPPRAGNVTMNSTALAEALGVRRTARRLAIGPIVHSHAPRVAPRAQRHDRISRSFSSEFCTAIRDLPVRRETDTMFRQIVFALVAVDWCCSAAFADWPQFRGPQGNGYVTADAASQPSGLPSDGAKTKTYGGKRPFTIAVGRRRSSWADKFG